MNLFLYGTLRAHPLMRAVGGGEFHSLRARLPGYRVTGVVGDVVPTIFASEADAADGLLLLDVTPEAMARFDLFEEAWNYRRLTVPVLTADGEMQAEVYLPPNEQVSNGKSWSLSDWEQTYCVSATSAAEEMFSRDPLPDAAGFRTRWPMALSRAWSRARAVARATPATLRFDGDLSRKPDLARIFDAAPPSGTFFAMQSFRVSHQRFDGTRSDDLPREVFLGIDAALVLPYDPVTDLVLLVEQLRIGPLRLGEPNPWVLEPIAGIVDAGETPQEAARREAMEEAGLTDLVLEHINDFYPSPGGTTDHFYCYLGLTQLTEGETYSGGVETEHEDLRLHRVPFARAMALAKSGEINAGPLLTMLYWLALHRDRLRA